MYIIFCLFHRHETLGEWKTVGVAVVLAECNFLSQIKHVLHLFRDDVPHTFVGPAKPYHKASAHVVGMYVVSQQVVCHSCPINVICPLSPEQGRGLPTALVLSITRGEGREACPTRSPFISLCVQYVAWEYILFEVSMWLPLF